MTRPKVSIIVPVYNVEKYIDKCMASLVHQTLKDIEIIVVDDCGNDTSMEIVKKYASKDKRIKVIKNEYNMGLSASRNNGIDVSSAPYVMCCDSDDFYAPDMCEKMYNAVSLKDVDIAMCGTEVIYEADFDLKNSDDEYYKVKKLGILDINDDLILDCNVNSWNKIFRKDIINSHNIRFPIGLKYEDAYFFRVYMLWAKKINLIPDKLYYYRRRAGSIMNETFKKTTNFAIDHVKIAIEFFDYLKNWNLYDIKYKYFWCNFFIPYVKLAIFNSKSKKDIKNIYNLANDFINKEYIHNTTNFFTEREIVQIKRRTFNKTRKYAFGLFAIKENLEKSEYRVLGIPLYKILYSEKRRKHYFCGIHLFNIKSLYKLTYKIPKIKEVAINNDSILSELRHINNFTYIPNPGNMGDMLIAFATLNFFDMHNIPYKLYDGGIDKNIVYGGGGIWTKDYEKEWSRFLPLFQKAKKIIILPSSFNNCQKLIDILDEKFIIFCREQQSYDYLMSKKTKAKIILDHDMAFRITEKTLKRELQVGPDEIRIANKLRHKKVNKVAWFTRTDCECAGNYKSDMDLSSYAYGSETAPRQWINASAMLMLETVARARTVITDRLHVAIAASLVSSDVYMLDNTYGKLSAVYEHSMKDRPRVHFCKSISEIPIDEQD